MGRVFSPQFGIDGNLSGMAVTGATTGRELDATAAKRVEALIALNEPGRAPAQPQAATPRHKPGFDHGL